MDSWRRAGSFRQRVRKTEETTRQCKELARLRAVARVYETIHDFEENLKIARLQESQEDLPIDAEADNQRHAQSKSAWRDNGSDSSSVIRSKPFALSSTLTSLKSNRLVLDAELRSCVQRPPSPLSFYDYGCISGRPRSVISQRSKKEAPEPEATSSRPAWRDGNCGFYFPGPDSKQGPYGFSMLDPHLLPPRNWEPSRAPMEHPANDPGEYRPATTEGILPMSRTRGVAAVLRSASEAPPRPSTAGQGKPRVNNCHQQRSLAMALAVGKKRDEAFLEQAKFERGIFDGVHRQVELDPMVTVAAEWDPIELPARLLGEKVDSGACSHQELLAWKILNGLEATQTSRCSKLSHLFTAVNQGVRGVLTPREFIDGLCRIGIATEGELSPRGIIGAMAVIDPDFDGRINLPAVNRAIAAVRAWRVDHVKQAGKPSKTSSLQIYGRSVPFEVVVMDPQPRSLCTFERSFERFRVQQHELLVRHKET